MSDSRKMSFHEFYSLATAGEKDTDLLDNVFDVRLGDQKLMFMTNISGVSIVVCEYDFSTSTGHYYL